MDFYSPREVAQLLGVAPVTVRLWASRGILESVKTAGNHRRFERTEVLAFARRHGYVVRADGALAGPSRPFTVLVVDDDDTVLEMLKSRLEALLPGAGIDVAQNGFAGGVAAGRKPYDLVLLDVRMPGLDGVEACRLIRSVSPHSLVVAMSAQLDARTADAMRASGASECVPKPLSDADLQRCVAACAQRPPLERSA